jgi:hypothetical protein
MTLIPRPFQTIIQLSLWQPIFHFHTIQISSGAHPASYSMKLTIHLHLMLGIRMHGAKHPLLHNDMLLNQGQGQLTVLPFNTLYIAILKKTRLRYRKLIANMLGVQVRPISK